MNVCFLHCGFSKSGGIERVVSVIINSLSREDDLGIYSLSYTCAKESAVFPIDSRVHNDYLFEDTPTMTNAILHRSAIKKTKQYIKNNKIDIIVGCGALYFPLAVISAKLMKIRSVCWEHTNPKITTDYKFQKECRQIGVSFSDANVVITKLAFDWYEEKRSHMTKLIYNPVDSALFEVKHGYKANTNKVISVGRLVKVKNYECVIEISKEMVDEGWNGEWDVYGEGPERARIEELIRDNNLQHVVKLKGNSNDIYNVYNDYSVLVMTSKYEGFPMVLLEGAALGMPLISFDIETGPNEIIYNGVNGFLITPFDKELMKKHLMEVLSSESMRNRMSIESRNISKRYLIDQILHEWRSLFDEISNPQ